MIINFFFLNIENCITKPEITFQHLWLYITVLLTCKQYFYLKTHNRMVETNQNEILKAYKYTLHKN